LRRRDVTGWLTATPSVVIVAVCCALPLGWMAITLLQNASARAEFSIDAFRAALIGRTLRYNISAALIAVAMSAAEML
jgi:hypothetical protein